MKRTIRKKSPMHCFKISKKVKCSDIFIVKKFEKVKFLLIETQKDTISIIKILSNMLFLLNGAAITICISQGIIVFLPAIRFFVSGLLLSLLLFIVGYMFHAGSIFKIYYFVQHKEHSISKTINNIRFDFYIFVIAMFFSVFISLLFFLWGAEVVLDILTPAKL